MLEVEKVFNTKTSAKRLSEIYNKVISEFEVQILKGYPNPSTKSIAPVIGIPERVLANALTKIHSLYKAALTKDKSKPENTTFDNLDDLFS